MLKLLPSYRIPNTIRTQSAGPLQAVALRAGCCEAHTFTSTGEGQTQVIAAQLAQRLLPGDVYLLTGPVGAGKSVFSRAFIRGAYDDDFLPVPSPTYLLQNIYDELEGPEIHHFDLYRIDNPATLARLQLDQSFKEAVSLIEWAERLPESMQPVNRLDIDIMPLQKLDEPRVDSQGEEWTDARHRQIRLTPHGEVMKQRCQELLDLF